MKNSKAISRPRRATYCLRVFDKWVGILSLVYAEGLSCRDVVVFNFSKFTVGGKSLVWNGKRCLGTVGQRILASAQLPNRESGIDQRNRIEPIC
jgi:hypothetical protein